MIKNNKLTLILSSVVTLLPIILGAISSNISLIVLPLILLAVQWVCVIITSRDPRNKAQNSKIQKMVIWIIPVISIFSGAFSIAVESGYEFPPTITVSFLMAALFVFVGNYLPKCKRNSTIGIKIKRTLESDSNWNATHRFAGKVWVICGILMLFTAFLSYKYFPIVIFVIIAGAIIIPTLYSHIFYKKELKNGTYSPDKSNLMFYSKKAKTITILLITLLCVFCVFVMFSGDIEIIRYDKTIQLEASYWYDTVIDISDIESIEYVENISDASRTNGFAGAKLLLGEFTSEEFGSHTRYCYTKCDSAIIIKTDSETYVFNLETEEATKELYESLIK